jgi:hypothetical protein
LVAGAASEKDCSGDFLSARVNGQDVLEEETGLDDKECVWIQSENGFLGMGPYPTKDQVDP